MKPILLTSSVAAFTVMLATTLQAQPSPLLIDFGGSAPTPGPNDVAMTDETTPSPGEPPGLNFYSNGGYWGNPGEIFTTGANSTGYFLNSVYFLMYSGAGDNINSTAQKWDLFLYQYNTVTSNATLLATYISQPFTYAQYDWLQFTNLGAGLQPNTTYAFTILNTGVGWELFGAEDTAGTDLYTNGEAVLIPSGGGVLVSNNFPTTPGWQADFDVNLTPITSLVVNPCSMVTPGNVYVTPAVNAVSNGTAVTFAAGSVLGAGPFFYQWQTDGGSGGTPTNIPGANATTLVVGTPTLGLFQYAVAVSNSLNQSATSAVIDLTVSYPLASALLIDEGATNSSSPYYLSISQLTGGGTGDTLNYYDNNPAKASQTFTTGANAQGYLLTSLQFATGPAGGSESGINNPQGYYLYIYNVTPSRAVLLQAYADPSFAFANDGDWLAWIGLNLQLAPNTTYAYSLAISNDSGNWCGLQTSATPNYSGGELCMINPTDGSIIYDPVTNNSAMFDLGLTAIGAASIPQPYANGIQVSPTAYWSGYSGTQYTLSEAAFGATPLSYIWQTDGGSGGTLTNIPSVNSSNLVLNTTGWIPGNYRYDVIVSNASGTATSSAVTVTLIPSTSTANLIDAGTTVPTPGPYDIYQLTDATGANSPPAPGSGTLNFYFDNSTPPGQTFTTGGNPEGYVLTNAFIALAGNGGGLPTNGQAYFLRLYGVNTNTSTATLYGVYESETNFVLTTSELSDWVEWTGLNFSLAPNATYAYSFGRDHAQTYDGGWDNVANVSGDLYTGGQLALVPTAGGALEYANPQFTWDGAVDLGLSLAGAAPVTVGVQKLPSGQVQLQWTTGTLLQAPSLLGPWTTNSSPSPYLFTPSAPQMFYKVQTQ
jgi:hypothetical protein